MPRLSTTKYSSPVQEWASGRLPLLHVRNVSLAMIDQGKLGTGEPQLGGARSTSVLCLH